MVARPIVVFPVKSTPFHSNGRPTGLAEDERVGKFRRSPGPDRQCSAIVPVAVQAGKRKLLLAGLSAVLVRDSVVEWKEYRELIPDPRTGSVAEGLKARFP